MKRFSTLWQRITRTKYTSEIEAELARQGAELDRLRAENRALLNSILGVAGIPPLSIPQARLTVDLGAPFDAEPLPSQSHSESSTRPLADDDSTFRPPPPADHSGTDGHSALRQQSERSDSTGAPLPSEQEGAPRSTHNRAPGSTVSRAREISRAWGISRPRNDSLHSAPRVRPVAPPHRRRSWHQITRILEIESARKPAAANS